MTNEWIDWNDSRMLPPLRSANYNYHPQTFLPNNYQCFTGKFHLKGQKLQQLTTNHSKLKGSIMSTVRTFMFFFIEASFMLYYNITNVLILFVFYRSSHRLATPHAGHQSQGQRGTEGILRLLGKGGPKMQHNQR